MTDLAVIEQAARELVDRHGRAAIASALARVERSEKEGGPTQTAALLLLSAVERLLEPGTRG